MLASTAVLIICGSSYFSMLLGVLRSVMVMRMIGPSSQGVRKLVDLANKYLSNSHLGVLHGVNKQVPILLGQGKHEQVQRVEDVGVSWILLLSLLASVGLAIWGLTNPTGTTSTSIAIVIGAGTLLISQTYTVYRTIARAFGNFAALGIVGGVETAATFGLVLLGAWRWGLNGTMGGALLAQCIALVVLGALAPIRIRVSFDLQEGLTLAKIGLPIAFIIFSDTLLRTVDQSVLGYYFRDAYHFGLYSIATQIAGYLYAIPEAAGFVIWPKILQAYGRVDGDGSAMRRQILLPTLLSGIYMPVLAGMVFVMLPALVNMVLPHFANATAAAQMLSLGAVFLAIPMAPNSLLIAHNRELTVVMTKLIGAGVGALCCWWVIAHIGGSLMALAVSASIGYAVAAALTVYVVLPEYEKNWLGTAKMFLTIFAPFGWACVALKISSRLGTLLWQHFIMEPLLGVLPIVDATPQLSWKFAFMRLAVFLCLMAPVVIYGNRKTRFGSELKRMVKSWINKGKTANVEPDNPQTAP